MKTDWQTLGPTLLSVLESLDEGVRLEDEAGEVLYEHERMRALSEDAGELLCASPAGAELA